MASKVLSRFLPGAESVFDSRKHDDFETQRMLEAAGGSDHGQEDFHDFDDEQELDDMLVEAPRRSRGRGGDKGRHHQASMSPKIPLQQGAIDASSSPPQSLPFGNDVDDVPASLMMEDRKPDDRSPDILAQEQHKQPATSRAKQQWAQPQQLHSPFQDRPRPSAAAYTTNAQSTRRTRVDRREQALWRWTNVENVDGFLLEVYQYYTDHGIWSILLARLVHILTTAFLFSAYMFLSTCIDYSKVPSSKSTGEILIPKCMAKTSFFKNAMLWVFVFWWSWTLFRYLTDIGRLWQLHDFYHYLLGIPDSDIQTIAWERVVESMMGLRDSNPETADNLPRYLRKVSKTTQSKQRMDAHDIANRLMRRDNYYIALINKEILDLQLQLPVFGTRHFYSKSLEWCISFCFENFIFDSHGHVQQHCLDPKLRLHMIETLRRRFRFAAVISVLMAPLNITAQCILFFSRYYAEFRNSPAQLGARAFTPLAEWKMRDFNELEHDFQRRLKMAYPFADRYLAQFPRDKTIQFLQFVSLVAGTVAAVLGTATLLDPELFLGFEITPNRTAFFYLSVSMGIFAAARNAVPDDSEVHEPVLHLFEVIEYTHYAPQRWRNNFHTPAVRAEFSSLYQMKVLIFLDEILSLVAAPFILWRNAGKPSAAIVDFFRQNTVHVDGLGGLCNHAVFEFRKRNKPEDDDAADAAHDLRDEYFGVLHGGGAAAKDQKMAQSQYYFMQRLGRYEGRQAERYNRAYMDAPGLHHHHHPLPPAFPPLSPLREAARPHPRRGREGSPRQSALLDLHGRPSRRRPSGTTHTAAAAAASRRKPSDALSPRVEVDLTTSKLIEADNSLADSWKFDRDEDEDERDESRARETGRRQADHNRSDDGKQTAGVVGLLMEYTKAHQGMKKGGIMG